MGLAKSRAGLAVLTLLLAGLGQAACAQSGVFGADTLHGPAEIGVSGGDTERAWTDGGFGKLATARKGFDVTQAALEWKPDFNFAVSGVVSAVYQSATRPGLDLGEAYLKLKAPPTGLGKISARAGLFYPPVSEEHDGVAWTTPDMLSASVLNSWVGEEVKVTGAEVTLQRPLGEGHIEVTAGAFGWDDTAGTLLTFRGWAGHEVRAGARTEFPLPPLSPFASMFQPRDTYPNRELDNRAGFYGRIEWRPGAPVSFNAFYYDNAGNRTAVDAEGQWAWETRFANLGLKWEPSETTRVLAQAMNGETLMGYVMPGGIWFDMGFQSAYVLAAHKIGDDTVSGRIETFRTHDRTFQAIDNNNEHGWALTAAWRHRLARHADVFLEAEHMASDRPSRIYAGDAAHQDETLLRSALRLSF